MAFTFPPNRSESAILFPEELNGSLAADAGLVGLEVKGSGHAAGAAAVSFGLAANRSGSGAPAVVPNGSAEAEKGSSGVKVALEGWKKASAAKGSDPLNGSPPNGSDLREACNTNIGVYLSDNAAFLNDFLT